MQDKSRFLFLDFQTTGPKPEKGEVLEIAWAAGNSEITSLVLRPERTQVSKFIQKMTGITEAVLAEAVTLEVAVLRLQESVKNFSPEAVIIHYAKFEQPFLDEIKTKFCFELGVPVLCTHEIAKRIYPNLPARGVAGLAGYFGLPMKEKKRGRDHIEATQVIWNGLVPQVASLGIKDIKSLVDWLQTSKPAKKTKYEYPLPKEKRLTLPAEPGVYRMLGKNGEVLYVGKATSLRDRVNSYFRGQKKRNSFKLQMLTQVWDIDVSVCDTPLEAALLECDEIKKWNPKYNIALKAGEREITFYSRDFSSFTQAEDETHILGPFPGKNTLQPVLRMAAALKENLISPEFPEDLLFEPIEAQKLKDGFKIFCETHSLMPEQLQSVRSLLSLGMKWYRTYLQQEEVEDVEETELAEEETNAEEVPEDEATSYTPEEVAEKLLRLCMSSAASLRRSKKLKKLFHCEVDIKDSDGSVSKTISLVCGQIRGGSELDSSKTWDVAAYDRLTVLVAESKRLSLNLRPISVGS